MNKLSIIELMVRFGFLVEARVDGILCIDSNLDNQQHFMDVVAVLKQRGITLHGEMVEEDFITILEDFFESTGESLFHTNELAIHTVDIYVRGLVMQLNCLGCSTTYSCDGHGRRRAEVYFETVGVARKAKLLLEHVGLTCRLENRSVKIRNERYELPKFVSGLAELSKGEADDIMDKNSTLLKEQEYYRLLEELLSIYGVSGEEGQIREFVTQNLTQEVDHLEVDHYGNVLAQISKGNGPTVLINAHLDTVYDFVEDREILKNGSIWSSSEGVLGADDRAGVCVALAIAKTIRNSDFNGTVKFVFTVEEEIGLRGASKVAKSFLWDVDMAFVVDRRGTGDIVTSCGGYLPFCSAEFARQVERIGRIVHPGRWQTVPGGSSDTRIWAEQGINSVNLSTGYNNEHTSEETLDIQANYGTYEFVMLLMEKSQSLMRRNLERRTLNANFRPRQRKLG
ncbi:M20/M25/M40 family metallo-hydrolase [Ureibacillus acetophenoni]|uniref:Peptidase M28-like protein n=1 Tax=Ureibacillus acetophenoni TaxID=614649 RepID=A0A285UHT3_9BACL|nr:M20/M25/M40 family metallo-hydrolase [Ureibacillus acetophenoni]SOC41465.1 peptidase M28-like protein [Ureibacillus acetophenoni]